MEAFEHTGRFWLPGQEDRHVAGVLSFDRVDGGQLSLIGALHDDPIISTPQAVDRLILGVAGRSEVSLIRRWLRSNPWNSPGWLEETWIPHAILRGACLDRSDALVFDNVYCEIDALLEWTTRARIERDYRDGVDRRFVGVVIQHDEVPPESIELDDGGLLELRFPWATEGDSVRDSTVRQKCVIHRSWAEPQALDDVLTPTEAPLLFAEAKLADRDLRSIMAVMQAIADDPPAHAGASPAGRRATPSTSTAPWRSSSRATTSRSALGDAASTKSVTRRGAGIAKNRVLQSQRLSSAIFTVSERQIWSRLARSARRLGPRAGAPTT